MHASVTFNAATAATAASAALPPAFRMRRPASLASGCEVQQTPCVQSTGERRLVKCNCDDIAQNACLLLL